MVGQGAYVEWPAGVNGARKITNTKSHDNDFVPLSIAAAFIIDKLSESIRKHPDRALEQCRQKARKMTCSGKSRNYFNSGNS